MTLAPIAFAILGCYEFVPTQNPATLVGRPAQFDLTDSGAVVLAASLGPSIDAIEGTLLADSAGAYVVGVSSTRARNGVESSWRGERIVIDRRLVWAVSSRHFSPTRTALVAGLSAVGLGSITAAMRGKGESSGGGPLVNPPVTK